ncbi:Retrotransposon gag domain [Sesbania bispinosa]|nr:Retrotransposon gag domain [Sesbania bispinosa]
MDDFPEMEGERIDLNVATGRGLLGSELEGTHFVTPIVNETPMREELNLLDGLGTARLTVTKNNSHAMVPRDVLNSIMTSQQSLANLVADLQAQTKDGGVRPKVHNQQGNVGASQKCGDDAPVTQGELRRLLQAGREDSAATFDIEPPLAEEVLNTPHPAGYQPPSFRRFDGTSSAREHLMSFLDDLGLHRNNKELRLKEFSKSLSGRAFTWYVKLRPRSIKTWEELAAGFCGKFFEEEGALHIMDLGRVKQKSGEGLLTFIKHYRDRAMQCKETLP